MTDLRIQKTYLALTNSLLVLLETKRFENITVNEICDVAMVRRATFYKHFGDKYELFAFVIRSVQEKYHQKLLSSKSDENVDPYLSIVIETMNFLDENENLVNSVMKSEVFSVLLDIISEQLVLDTKELFRKDKKNGKEIPVNIDMMANAFTGAFISLARWWVSNKDQIGKEEMIEQMSVLLKKILG